MGCDIHLRVEYLAPVEGLIAENGTVKVIPDGRLDWQPAEPLKPNKYRQMWLDQLKTPFEERQQFDLAQGRQTTPTDEQLRGYANEEPEMCLNYEDRFYTGRHYGLFYKLSAVRGPYENIEPMRGAWDSTGLPDDLSDEVAEELSLDDADLHSHTHYTLTELLEVDWREFDREHGADFYPTIQLMEAIALEKCSGDTDRVRAVMAYDN